MTPLAAKTSQTVTCFGPAAQAPFPQITAGPPVEEPMQLGRAKPSQAEKLHRYEEKTLP